MRRFGTQGRVYSDKHYVVRRHEEISDFLTRVEEGRYIVLFAPRQTGKTTFFRLAFEKLCADSPIYLPIQLNFEAYQNLTRSEFYEAFCNRVIRDIRRVYQTRNIELSESLSTFLDNTKITNHISMMDFFEDLSNILIDMFGNQTGKRHLATYLKLENVNAGYYVVFDHHTDTEPVVETETIDGFLIRSYVIPVVQERPSSV